MGQMLFRILSSLMAIVILSAAVVIAVDAMDQKLKPKVYVITGVAIPAGMSDDGRIVDVATASLAVRKNAPILINHINNTSTVIGKITSLYRENGALKFTAELIADTAISKEIIERVKRGSLKALSVGVMPKEVVLINTPEGMALMGLYARVFEISIVAVPAYEHAEIESIKLKE